ncbi:hypothetical protein AcW1_000853 [Taiwanofungus camphoratus]|nr:hypothetical protein AcW1_000853 [Antrodia cinnamomea]
MCVTTFCECEKRQLIWEPIQHFRQFVSVLQERGVDMHKVEISKAELALWGIEHLAKFKKKQSIMFRSCRDKIRRTMHAAKRLSYGDRRKTIKHKADVSERCEKLARRKGVGETQQCQNHELGAETAGRGA